MREPYSAPVELWRRDPLSCVVIHHWEQRSYEIQLLDDGQVGDAHVIDRRWFSTDTDAAAFAMQSWHACADALTL